MFNDTFEPGCRNNWHIHNAKEGGGQILVWDDPTYQTEYEDYWEIEGYTLILRYDEKEKVISCELIEPNEVE